MSRASDSAAFELIYTVARAAWLADQGYGVGVGTPGVGNITLSNGVASESMASGVTVGTIGTSDTGTWAFSLVSGYDAGGRFAVSGSNLVTTSVNFNYDLANTYAIRIRGVRTLPYVEIVQEFNVNVTPVLNSLTIDQNTFLNTASPGTVIANVTGLRTGSAVTLTPDDGKVVYSSGRLLTGLNTSALGTTLYAINEILAGISRTTTVGLTASAIALQPALNNLTLDTSVFDVAAATNDLLATIQGRTTGSMITISANGNKAKIGATDTQILRNVGAWAAGSLLFSITETLVGSPNNPRTTNFIGTVLAPPVFETMSSTDKSNEITVSGGGLVVGESASTDYNAIRSVHGITTNTGKFQFQVTVHGSTPYGRIGFAALSNALFSVRGYNGSGGAPAYLGSNGNSMGFELQTGRFDMGGYPNTGYTNLGPCADGDILTFLVDTTYDAANNIFPSVQIAKGTGNFDTPISLQSTASTHAPSMGMYYGGQAFGVAASIDAMTDTTMTFNFGGSTPVKAVVNGTNLWPPNVGGGTPDTVPDVFSFPTLLNQTRDIDVNFPRVTVNGVTVPVPVTITGGLYQKNGAGGYVSTDTTASNGDYFDVRAHTPTGYSQSVAGSMTIGPYTQNFQAVTLVDPAAPPIPVVTSSSAWTGAAASGYQGTLPTTDPYPGYVLRQYTDMAKPAMSLTNPEGIRFNTDLTIGVDAESWLDIKQVNAYVEGGVVPITTKVMKVDQDANGNTRRREGFYCKLDVASFLAKSTTGTVRVWFEAVPNDTGMASRFIGPFDYYPRPSAYSGIYNIGSGQTYATLKAAITAARTANEEAACFIFKTTGTYDMEDETSLAMHKCNRGFWTIMADVGVTATLHRPTINWNDNQSWIWKPKLSGIEFRGSNLIIDAKYCAGIEYTRQTPWDNSGYGHWFNGTLVTNSEGKMSSWYWNGDVRPGFNVGSCYWDDSRQEFIPNGLAGSIYVIGCTVLDTEFAGPTGTPYVAYNYYNGFDPNFFFYQHDNLHISYTGAGTATMETIGSYGVGPTLNPGEQLNAPDPLRSGHNLPVALALRLKLNGALVADIPCGVVPNDPGFAWSAIQTAINSHAGWHADLGSDPNDPTNVSATGWLIVGNDTPVTATPTSIGYYRDFHCDFMHGNEPHYENWIYRGNRVVGDTNILGASTLTMFRFADGPNQQCDTFLIDNCMHFGYGSGPNGKNMSHFVASGNSFGRREWQPAGSSYDSRCIFQDNVTPFWWAADAGPTLPIWRNDFVITRYSITSSLNGTGSNSGNYAIGATSNPTSSAGNTGVGIDNATSLSLQVALFRNVDSGDFRPSVGSALLNDLKVRRGKWDARGYPRNPTGDVAGAFSKDTPAPFTLAYLPGGVFANS